MKAGDGYQGSHPQWERLRETAEDLLDQAYDRGAADAAQELMGRLHAENAIRGDGWRGPEVITAVGQWLREHGVDPDAADDEEEAVDDRR